MKTHMLGIPWRTLLLGAALPLFLAAWIIPHPHIDAYSIVPEIAAKSFSRPSTPKGAVKTLPFSMQDVVAFLKDDLQAKPVQIERDYALFTYLDPQPNGSSDQVVQITVNSTLDGLRVTFTFREFTAMHYVAEFIESPMFTRTESERLYALLYARSGRDQWERVERFHTRVLYETQAEHTEVRFEFAPLIAVE